MKQTVPQERLFPGKDDHEQDTLRLPTNATMSKPSSPAQSRSSSYEPCYHDPTNSDQTEDAFLKFVASVDAIRGVQQNDENSNAQWKSEQRQRKQWKGVDGVEGMDEGNGIELSEIQGDG